MPKKEFASLWHKLRELVVLSLNIIFIKDTLQQCERLKAKLSYINIPDGSTEVTMDNLRRRKHNLNLRVKDLLENDLLLPRLVVVDIPNASLTKKQLDKGYAFFTDIRENTIAFDLRKGTTYPITTQEIEENTTSATMNALEYNATHLGSVLRYFEIDQSDPLKGKDLRY
jgi:hypothetical protein